MQEQFTGFTPIYCEQQNTDPKHNTRIKQDW